jgi:hypothetical protein
MTKAQAWILIGIVVIVGGFLVWHSYFSATLPTAPVTNTSNQPVSLDTQSQCASAAKSFFNNWETNPSASNSWAQAMVGSGDNPYYTDHYNTQLGECFIEINGLLYKTPANGQYYNLTYVYDVYSNKLIGYSDKDSDPSDTLFLCQAPPDVSQSTACKNENSFEAAIAPYMNN